MRLRLERWSDSLPRIRFAQGSRGTCIGSEFRSSASAQFADGLRPLLFGCTQRGQRCFRLTRRERSGCIRTRANPPPPTDTTITAFGFAASAFWVFASKVSPFRGNLIKDLQILFFIFYFLILIYLPTGYCYWINFMCVVASAPDDSKICSLSIELM